MIYFIQESGNGYIKIGFSQEPLQRLRQLSKNQPYEYNLIGVLPGHLPEEKALHKKFSDFSVKGEWFCPSKDLIDFIESKAYMLYSCGKNPKPITGLVDKKQFLAYNPDVFNSVLSESRISVTELAILSNVSEKEIKKLGRWDRNFPSWCWSIPADFRFDFFSFYNSLKAAGDVLGIEFCISENKHKIPLDANLIRKIISEKGFDFNSLLKSSRSSGSSALSYVMSHFRGTKQLKLIKVAELALILDVSFY